MLGIGKRISYAFRCFFSIVSNGEIPEEIAPELVNAEALETPALNAPATRSGAKPAALETPAKPTPETTDRAVQMLALLQRDGRLIDFFAEDIAPYSDAQIGAAVRELHENCRRVLEQYVTLAPVIDSEENQPVTVGQDFDPASVKLTGNVVGQPPLRGLLRHKGWRAAEVKLPPLPDGAGRSVIAPAEVEIP